MTENLPYDLIIFDCDGTLADTEPAHSMALSTNLIKIGLTHYTPEKCIEVFSGTAFPGIMQMVIDKYDITLPDDFAARSMQSSLDFIADHMTLEPTTDSVLNALFNSPIKIAVGSNGMRETVLATLKSAGFDQYFSEDRVFTFEDVARPKPAPDLYLYVCSQMGVNPEKALVIEDTVKGAMGGINANIDVVGYTGLTHRNSDIDDRLRVAGCRYMIERMEELREIVGV